MLEIDVMKSAGAWYNATCWSRVYKDKYSIKNSAGAVQLIIKENVGTDNENIVMWS